MNKTQGERLRFETTGKKPKNAGLKFTHEETCALVLKAQAGNKQARSKLIDANIGLVWLLAMKQTGNDRTKAQEILACGIAGNDFENEKCTSGLVRAIELFDVTRGMRFSTYARHWISTALRDATLDDGPSRNSHEVHWQIKKAAAKLVHILKRDPTSSEIAEHLNRHWSSEGMTKRISAKKVDSLISINVSIATDPHELEQLEANNINALAVAANNEQVDQVRDCLDLLPLDERRVVELAFGFNNNEAIDLVAIAKKLKMPRHKVADLIKLGLSRVKEGLRK